MAKKSAPKARKQRLNAIQKTLRILEAVSMASGPLSMAEIGKRTGITRPTAHRITNSLVELNYLERTAASRTYSEGSRLLLLATSLLTTTALREKRRAVLTDVRRQCGESCHLVVLREAQATVVDEIACELPLSVSYGIDARLPLHCTAAGKLIAALQAPAQRHVLIGQDPLGRFTERTMIDRRQLSAALDEIRTSHISLEDGEHVVGVTAIAVPILLSSGQLLGALLVSGPTLRFTRNIALTLTPRLREAASNMAKLYERGQE